MPSEPLRYLSAADVARIHGDTIAHEGGVNELEKTTRAVAAGDVSKEDLVAWMRRRVG